MNFFLQFLFSFLSTVGFGIITNIPRRTLISAGLTGALGWLIYYYCRDLFSSDALGNFLGAVAIGLLSIWFARKLKTPTIIINIPALVPLVPGGPSYQMVRNLVESNNEQTFHYLVKVIVTAGAIAGGFMISSLVEKKMIEKRLISRFYYNNIKNKRS